MKNKIFEKYNIDQIKAEKLSSFDITLICQTSMMGISNPEIRVVQCESALPNDIIRSHTAA